MAIPTAGRGRRRGQPTGDDRETAILATAERLLADRPLTAISVDDLARGAGISRPTFYFYFASKDAVLLALLDRVVAEADAGTGGFGDADGDGIGSPRERWRRVLSAYVHTFRAHRPVALAVATARVHSTDVRELWEGIVQAWVQRTAAAIEAERARGAAPAGVPARDLAIALNAMNEGVILGSFRDGGPAVAPADVLDVLLDTWLLAIYHTPHPA